MAWKKKGTDEEVKAEIPETKKEEEKETIVSELPQVPVRKVKGDDGNNYNLITTNEALQEILEGVRELLKRTEE